MKLLRVSFRSLSAQLVGRRRRPLNWKKTESYDDFRQQMALPVRSQIKN